MGKYVHIHLNKYTWIKFSQNYLEIKFLQFCYIIGIKLYISPNICCFIKIKKQFIGLFPLNFVQLSSLKNYCQCRHYPATAFLSNLLVIDFLAGSNIFWKECPHIGTFSASTPTPFSSPIHVLIQFDLFSF